MVRTESADTQEYESCQLNDMDVEVVEPPDVHVRERCDDVRRESVSS